MGTLSLFIGVIGNVCKGAGSAQRPPDAPSMSPAAAAKQKQRGKRGGCAVQVSFCVADHGHEWFDT
jgi:hypothetical protein